MNKFYWWTRTVYDQGGPWLGAVRNRIKWICKNGEQVTWGSNDVLQPPLTIGQVEELAAEAVAADRNEQFFKASTLLRELVAAIESKDELSIRLYVTRAHDFIEPKEG